MKYGWHRLYYTAFSSPDALSLLNTVRHFSFLFLTCFSYLNFEKFHGHDNRISPFVLLAVQCHYHTIPRSSESTIQLMVLDILWQKVEVRLTGSPVGPSCNSVSRLILISSCVQGSTSLFLVALSGHDTRQRAVWGSCMNGGGSGVLFRQMGTYMRIFELVSSSPLSSLYVSPTFQPAHMSSKSKIVRKWLGASSVA